jgi:hypothetical protein
VEGLRFPFFLGAVASSAMVVLIEFGSGLASALIDTSPPGIGIPYLALVDGILLFTLALMAVNLVVPASVVGRTQGCLTGLVSLALIIGTLVLILLAVVQLFVMIGLIASFFGAAIYLAVWGSFPHQAAAAILGLLLILKVAIAGCLVAAQPRFVQNKGLVALLLTSLIVNVVVSFLHALPPGVLVSLTDTVAAIVIGIVAVIWALILLIGAVVGVVKLIRVPQGDTGSR